MKFLKTNLRNAILDSENAVIRPPQADSPIRCSAANCGFTNTELQGARIQLDLTSSSFSDVGASGAVFDNSVLHAVVFTGGDLSNASLIDVRVDSITQFNNARPVHGCRIHRYTLACLKDGTGGLSAGNRMDMTIQDDVALLRSVFSGVWMWMHVLSLVAFAFPYLWFLGNQWAIARFIPVHDREMTVSLFEALLRFILRGGRDWRAGWTPHWPFYTFVAILGYNVCRAALLYKTKRLETMQEVSGLPVRFALHDLWGGFSILGGWSMGGGLIPWRWVFNATRYGFLIALVLLFINTYHFLTMRVPL